MSQSKADLAIAIIARNASRTIGACLDSLVPHVEQVVVAVDETTTDDTAAVALRHGAKVVTGHKVSEWHECPQHGKVLAQDFAKARQESFRHLRDDVEWWGWFDADDVVKGAELLAEYLPTLAPTVAGVWLPYHYAAAPNGQTTTLFDRERILRRSVGWEWQRRVHEVAVPKGQKSEEVEWARTDKIRVVHQGEGHDTAGSARRNILLLEIELERDPNDAWALFYLGNQWFALGDWDQAASYYRAATTAKNVYQLWQTWVYLSMAEEKRGNLGGALEAAYHAMDACPYHPEPCYRLAALYMLSGDTDRCKWWTQLGDRLPSPPVFVFQNPLDRTFNARVTLGQALRNAGHISEARREFERAASVIPSEPVVQGVEECRQLEEDTAAANAYSAVLAAAVDRGQPPDESPRWRDPTYPLYVPDRVWKFGRVRDVVVPVLLRQRPNTQPRIVFWCGRSAEPWAPPSIDGTGIGGSETAVIHIARRFAQDGWRVDVYNAPDYYEGEYEGVGYWGLERLATAEQAAVLVSWRNPHAYELGVERRVSLLWCHDLNQGPAVREDLGRWQKVLGVSRWHADYLSTVYGLANTDFVPNGIDLHRFAEPVKKIPFRCVYASAPDRGLADLLRLWPQIVAVEPSAELHVGYGWETFDKYIQMGATHLIPIKQEVESLLKTTPRVVWRGRLPQAELARLYQESYAWLYPTTFTEVSCISAMEAMAGGAVPVTSAAGALKETIDDGGLVVTGNAYTPAWREFWVACAKGVLLAPDVRLPLMAKGIERARAFTWDASYERWRGIVTGLLEGQKEAVLA